MVYDAGSACACIGMPRGVVDPVALTALSPLDGRYAAKASPLREYLSEFALIRYRTLVEIRWLEHLADEPAIDGLKPLDRPIKDVLNALLDGFGIDDARRVKEFERETNHDVKAVEYFLRQKLEGVSSVVPSHALAAYLHFACTSEDINNLAYALMLRDATQRVLLPRMRALAGALAALARRYADLPMLARTHGQPASPTTLGKEMANFAARLQRQGDLLANVGIFGKFNGAVGNFNAHLAAYPKADWRDITERFVQSLGLTVASYTTQIEPHDWLAEYCQALARYNTVMIDLCRDLWAYISIGYFRQRMVANEVGSSTMPHKINPIDFENSEGNLGIANALLGFLADKLPISRWQRDLTDSTVLRNLAVALGHSLIAYESCQRGLDRLEADPDRITAELAESWEVLAEAVQTVMRRHGIADAYERLKSLTRGRRITQASLREFVATLELPSADKARLLELTPSDYLGLAAELAREI
jgi:adenylosuccinate lyase